MTDQLKPCPFCGSEPHDAHHIEYGRWAVTCRYGASGASANTGPNATDAAKIKAYSDARTAWNTRALAQRPAQPSDGMPSSPSERHLRRLLAHLVAIPLTYYDDGEANGSEHGILIDFMREPVADIAAKIQALNVARALCQSPSQQATPRRATREAEQRARMQARLAARHEGKATADFDLPAQNDAPQQATPAPEFDDCSSSPTGKHSESWFGNGDCDHCKTGAQNSPMIATPEPVGEVVAWRLRASVESCGLQRFMTQAKYEKQTPAIKKWYEPFKCQSCATPKPEPMTQAMPQDMGHTTIMGDCIYAGIFEDEISEVNSAVVIKFESDDKLRDFLRWHHGITKEQA